MIPAENASDLAVNSLEKCYLVRCPKVRHKMTGENHVGSKTPKMTWIFFQKVSNDTNLLAGGELAPKLEDADIYIYIIFVYITYIYIIYIYIYTCIQM